MPQYAVFGNPIEHSKSPLIHAAFAQQTGRQLVYHKRRVLPEHFASEAAAFYREGGLGFNVTVPLKEIAYQWVQSVDPLAETARAVNTVVFTEGKSKGYNTDGVGLVRDLTNNHGVELKATEVLILGAGGAVRGILEPILMARPMTVTIANRTLEKARTLASAFDSIQPIRTCAFNALAGQQFDIIINATSAQLSGDMLSLPDRILRPGGVTYDLMYADTATAFVHWGRQQHARYALDGLGMLVEQAAEAFYLWWGVRPETSEVIQRLLKNV